MISSGVLNTVKKFKIENILKLGEYFKIGTIFFIFKDRNTRSWHIRCRSMST
jgi:hypothetical protein